MLSHIAKPGICLGPQPTGVRLGRDPSGMPRMLASHAVSSAAGSGREIKKP